MGKLFGSVLIGMLATLVLWSVGWAQGNEYDRGKSLYEQKCQICHGANGRGDGPAAAALSPAPANFTDPQFWQNSADKKIEDTIRKGKGAMPAFGLNEGEVKALIDYMGHAFGKK
jgi:mono/diheme cytochrome c family protein